MSQPCRPRFFFSATVCKDKKLAADIKQHFAATVAEGRRYLDPLVIKASLGNGAPKDEDDEKNGDDEGSETLPGDA